MDAELAAGLRHNPMLSCLTPEEWHDIAGSCAPTVLADGETLFHQNEAAHSLFLLTAGAVFLHDRRRAESYLGPLIAGEVIGTEALTQAAPYAHSAVAATALRAWALPAERLREALDRRFDAAMTMMAAVSGILRSRIKEISDFKLQSTTERLAGYLAGLAAAGGKGPAELRLPCTKRVLADHLGMDPATRSRSFAKLRPAGVRAGIGDQILVADLARLREVAASDGAMP